MRITVSQLRRIIKEEVRKSLTESKYDREFQPVTSDVRMYDYEPEDLAAYQNDLTQFAKMLGKSANDLRVASDAESWVDEAVIMMPEASVDMSTYTITRGTLDGQPVLVVEDSNNPGAISIYK